MMLLALIIVMLMKTLAASSRSKLQACQMLAKQENRRRLLQTLPVIDQLLSCTRPVLFTLIYLLAYLLLAYPHTNIPIHTYTYLFIPIHTYIPTYLPCTRLVLFTLPTFWFLSPHETILCWICSVTVLSPPVLPIPESLQCYRYPHPHTITNHHHHAVMPIKPHSDPSLFQVPSTSSPLSLKSLKKTFSSKWDFYFSSPLLSSCSCFFLCLRQTFSVSPFCRLSK